MLYKLFEKMKQDIKEMIDHEMEILDLSISTLTDQIKEMGDLGKVGHWSWDLEEDKITWSEEVSCMFQLDHSFLGMNHEAFLHFIPRSDRNLLRQKIKSAIESHEPYSIEHRVILPDGSIKYLFRKGIVATDQQGTPKRLFGVLQDITDKVTQRDSVDNIPPYYLKHKAWIEEMIQENKIEVYFQPIYDIDKGVINHFETLARIKDEKRGIILPGEFIPHAEMLGLIDQIDKQVIRKALLHKQQSKDHYIISLNLSGKYFGDESFLNYIIEMIDQIDIIPGEIVFEITETTAIDCLDRAIYFMNRLKKIGCRFALDDFGVGFTSFLYLRELPVDYIKIDGVFIRQIATEQKDKDIVKAIVSVAQGLGIKTVAEFVESEHALCSIKELGVSYAQGYFIGKPEETLSFATNHLTFP